MKVVNIGNIADAFRFDDLPATGIVIEATPDELERLPNLTYKEVTISATPRRNCDVMDWRTAWKMWREKFHPETPVGYSAVVKGTEAFMDWFTAPATEKEGANYGNE